MNLYFLLEDEKSFLKVLPSWFEYIQFGYTRVADIHDVKEKHYILQSGQGVTQLVTKVLFDTIDTICQNPGKIDKLIVILDTEELNPEERRQQVYDKIREHYGIQKFEFDIVVLVCNHCFETWLLGYRGLYPKEIDEESDFFEYYKHYNIEEKDPENMMPPGSLNETIAQYHFHYLHELLRHNKIRYSKNRPKNISTKEYFDNIVERINATEHLESLKKFCEFLNSIKI